MPFEMIRNDITQMQVDAIVNAANTALAPGGGVCGAIFRAAGWDDMQRACREIGHCDAGQAVITKGFDLQAKYVIHTPGPIWQGGTQGEAQLLRSCYISSLQLAKKKKCKSIAFPLISSGIYGYPKAEALRIAVDAISTFLTDNEMQVYLAVFDRSTVFISEKLFSGIQAFIDDNYVEEHRFSRDRQTELLFHERQLHEQEMQMPQTFQASMPSMPAAAAEPSGQGKKARSLRDLLHQLDDTFSEMLLRLIDEKGMTDVEVYKRANIDRKLFSKIRKSSYNPSKQTAIALAIALRLNLDETKDLLGRAGYALSHSNKFDVIIEYFISEGIYDIYEINEALFTFEQKTLGA